MTSLDELLDRTQLVVITSQFPATSETFIQREIHALGACDIDTTVISLKPPDRSVIAPELHARTCAAALFHLSTQLAALGVFITRPVRVLRMLGKLLQLNLQRPSALLRNLAIVPYALKLGRQLSEHPRAMHLHSHWANMPSTLAWVIWRVFGQSYSMAIHGEDIFTPDPFLAEKLRNAQFCVVCTEHFAEHLRGVVAPDVAGHIHVNYHGLDPLIRAASKRKSARQDTDKTPLKLLAVARLVPTKGLDTLLHALAYLIEQGEAIQLDIIGEGPHATPLKSLCTQLQLDPHVRFLGAQPHTEVVAAMLRTDIFCLLPRQRPGWPPDGIPNVLAEAMALGVPVISSRLPAIAELIRDDENGRLINGEDSQALAQAIYANLKQPEHCRKMAEQARTDALTQFNEVGNIQDLVNLLAPYLPDRQKDAHRPVH